MSGRKKLGLALGAGASRGFAHIGILQVLEENGIPVDVVTGCSMGALIGGLYVSGTNLHILEKYAAKFDMKKYFDISIKNGGFLKGRKIEELLRLLTKNIGMGQTRIPYACVAVDICTGEVKTFTEGVVYKAIRASISMPGIFTPYEIDGHIYIDGGVLERMPMQAARELGADVVVAVDVSYRGQRQTPPRNLIETLRWTLSISDWYIARHKEHQADVLVTPDVYEIDPFSSKQAALCIQRGREAIREKIPEIQRLLAE